MRWSSEPLFIHTLLEPYNCLVTARKFSFFSFVYGRYDTRTKEDPCTTNPPSLSFMSSPLQADCIITTGTVRLLLEVDYLSKYPELKSLIDMGECTMN